MSIIGIDLGTHSASIAVWHEDKDMLEVLADDLGFRTIPCVVAFRGDEAIVGHSAVGQQHKNAANTFGEVRSLLFDKDTTHVEVPGLEKNMSVEEINSLFFRNIHNQVKQQAGKIIREAVVTVPAPLDEETTKRYIGAAQAGGIRIKSFIEDSSAALLAYNLDDVDTNTSRTLVVDMGWSRSTVSLYNVSGGVFIKLASSTSTEVSGSIFVKLLAEFCAKDFQRKNKIPCNDNKRAMMRLRRECENAIRTLSTGQEATIDIDSLCEGCDYSSKVSRARFEDLLSIPVIHFKNLLNDVMTKSGLTSADVNQILPSGGPAAMPKVLTTLKAQFTNATFAKVRFETYEAACIGAAIHGKLLHQLGLLDHAPTQSPKAPTLTRSVYITANPLSGDKIEIIPANSALPARAEFPIKLPAAEGSFHVLLSAKEKADPVIQLGEVIVKLGEGESVEEAAYNVVVTISEEQGLLAQVYNGKKEVVTSLTVSF